MRLLSHLLLRHGALGRHQDHEAAEARQCGEEGPGGDRGEVLHPPLGLREGEHRQTGTKGQTTHGNATQGSSRTDQVLQSLFLLDCFTGK